MKYSQYKRIYVSVLDKLQLSTIGKWFQMYCLELNYKGINQSLS